MLQVSREVAVQLSPELWCHLKALWVEGERIPFQAPSCDCWRVSGPSYMGVSKGQPRGCLMAQHLASPRKSDPFYNPVLEVISPHVWHVLFIGRSLDLAGSQGMGITRGCH